MFVNRLILLIFKLLAFLPHSGLKVIGSFISFWLKFGKYRYGVISKNLSRSFPNKTPSEISRLTFDYYNYLGRLIAESVKLFHISRKELKHRVIFSNDEQIKEFLKKDKEVIVVMGHYGNWEWALLASCLNFDAEMIGIYKPLSSIFWNQKLYSIRGQFGAKLLTMKESLRYLLKTKNKRRLIGIIADQTPSGDEINHWITFLNQKTPVFLGTEKLAKKLHCPVFYASVSPQTFGRYTITFELLNEFPNDYKEGELTHLHSKKLENHINKRPAYWLWSHRRWKHQK